MVFLGGLSLYGDSYYKDEIRPSSRGCGVRVTCIYILLNDSIIVHGLEWSTILLSRKCSPWGLCLHKAQHLRMHSTRFEMCAHLSG